MRNLLIVTMVVLACVSLTACTQAPPPKPATPPPPPDPTPEEVAAEIRPCIQPLGTLLQDSGGKGAGEKGMGAQGGLEDAVKEQALNCLRTARSKHQVTEYGKAGLAIITHELESIISGARDQQRWRLVAGAIEAFEVLEPGNPKMNRLKERALLHINRPSVSVQGFFDDKQSGETYAFLDVMLKPSGEHVKVKAREGEEFNNIRLKDFYGDKKGVELEYLLIPGETWVVKGP